MNIVTARGRDYHSSGGYPAISFAAAVAEQTQAGERELLSTQGGRDCSMSELSEYERKRLQRIRENESFLKTLGAFWLHTSNVLEFSPLQYTCCNAPKYASGHVLYKNFLQIQQVWT